jgi:hypothetical protein
MSGAVPPLPQYAFMAWCSVKAQGQLYIYLTLPYLTLSYITLPYLTSSHGRHVDTIFGM